jgi:ribosomal protein S14
VHGVTDAIGDEFGHLLEALGLSASKPATKRPRRGAETGRRRVVMPRGFYTLRRTFRTIADESGDQHAVHLIMGHTLPGMSGVYVQRISSDRLRTVTEYVRAWYYTGACEPWPRVAGAGWAEAWPRLGAASGSSAATPAAE